jgi:ElaB/YqjD/DUF883 family membrane-anchored ribosome-binding protein
MLLVQIVAALLLGACSSVYYAGLEKMGIPKRDLLQTRVERARDAQVDVRQQFASALDRFRATVRVEGGDLEREYETMRHELERCQSRANELHDRIESVEDVAEALFDEWEHELDQYERKDLRAASQRRLDETRRRYKPMMASMRLAHRRVEPVLSAMRDIVLALKHRLNAKALGALDGELSGVERDVDALVRAMNTSIDQASKFLTGLDDTG